MAYSKESLKSTRVTGVAQKYLYIHTIGCQMNVHDSEQIAALLKEKGYQDTGDAGKADLIVINTCSIREKAAQKVYSRVGRFHEYKRRNPRLIICLTGCLAQQEGEKLLKRLPVLDMVIGTHNIHRLPELLETVEKTGSRITETAFRESVQSIRVRTDPRNGAVSAYVTIMQGCDNFCSFCVVPYLRGREESRPEQEILNEIALLADSGVREVTLLGQNVNSYGKRSPDGSDFATLLKKIGKIPGINRIRFTTSHPRDLSEQVVRCFKEVDKLCEHIHLPVQSGSDRILERMNRGYTSAQYREKVARLREVCSGISITSDVIVGFPGETDADFQATLALMDAVRFDNLFSFKYSEREGTAAVKLEGKVEEPLKIERLKVLQSLQEQHTLAGNKSREGRVEAVLVEGASKNSGCDVSGRTRTNRIVNFKGGAELIGKTVSVAITRAYLHSLRGELH
ncbi:MAG: tRNA (N6-isopentenyl adenosine(37)-C2)-methylthiotransferase MiaB [Deltaproteobacteria bacterium]|nr:tRNA (N6-isopentenyl adenosine(37)-C2)-methylthiotransferase MiaB [Deltaproteobacteria bacterium]